MMKILWVLTGGCVLAGCTDTSSLGLSDQDPYAFYNGCAVEEGLTPDPEWLTWEPVGGDGVEVRRVDAGDPYVVGEPRDEGCSPIWQREMSIRVQLDGDNYDVDGISMHGFNTKWGSDADAMDPPPVHDTMSYSFAGAGGDNLDSFECSEGFAPQRVVLGARLVLDGTDQNGRFDMVCQIEGDVDADRGDSGSATLADW